MSGYWIGVEQIKVVVQAYLELFPDEYPRLQQLDRLARSGYAVNRCDSQAGHVTVAAVVLDSADRVLHRVCPAPGGAAWTLPAGHLDPTDESLAAAARRRVTTEAGIPAEYLQPLPAHDLVPLDIDAPPLGQDSSQARCVHFELRYPFTVAAAAAGVTRPESIEWLPVTAVPDRLLRGKLLDAGLTVA